MNRSEENLKAAAEARVQAALLAIESAQRLLEEATQALSSVPGMMSEWRRVGALQDRVKAGWSAVKAKADRLRRQGRLELEPEPGSDETVSAAERL